VNGFLSPIHRHMSPDLSQTTDLLALPACLLRPLAPALTDAVTAAALPPPCWQPELLADGKLLDIALGIKITNSMLAALAKEDEANS
jgi:hypothetical protein